MSNIEAAHKLISFAVGCKLHPCQTISIEEETKTIHGYFISNPVKTRHKRCGHCKKEFFFNS